MSETTTASRPDRETTVTRGSVRQIARCKRCKTTRSRLLTVEITTTTRWTACGLKFNRTTKYFLGADPLNAWDVEKAGECACELPARARDGSPTTRRGTMYYAMVAGTKNDTPCDDRCTSATGHKCQCSCGGKNHGAAHG